jgi:molybdenum cofactor cytidylyltransferase
VISALILAAGASTRMGQPKMALPWGKTTVLGHVIRVLKAVGVSDILVVTGAARRAVEGICRSEQVRNIFNPEHGQDQMIVSLKVGLGGMNAATNAALIVLGDQPQIQESSVRLVLNKHAETMAPLVVPSYDKHRGHPWLLGRQFWGEVLNAKPPETPRDFLNQHAADIVYVEVDSPTILQDLDTPDDYLKMHP